MNHLIIFLVLFALYCDVSGQQSTCAPANGKRRKCIPIYECDELYVKYKNLSRSQEDTSLLQSSYCGFIGRKAAVCCPVTAGAICYTPKGESGECVGLKSCQNMQKLLLPPVENNTIQYLKRSRCYGVDQYSVCCGAAPELEPAEKGNCETKLSVFPPDPATECCGVDNVIKNKILGGNETTIDQYPWTVLIDYNTNRTKKTYCSGTLISNKYVLTVGTCVAGLVLEYGNPQFIRLGEYDTAKEGPDCTAVETGGIDCSDGAIRIPIAEMIVHPEFNPLLRTNDIALIRMASEAPFSDFIRPICLPWTNITKITTPVKLILAGWGNNEYEALSTKKLHVDLPFVNREECQRIYQVPPQQVNILKSHICAGGEASKDSCRGDAGAPLMYENNGVYELVGLVSFGPPPCGRKDIPGVHTNVYEHNAWIRSTIRPDT